MIDAGGIRLASQASKQIHKSVLSILEEISQGMRRI